MVYYDMKTHKLIGFAKSETKNKMYDAILIFDDGNFINVPFRDKRFENYQDKTKLNLYPHLIHGDMQGIKCIWKKVIIHRLIFHIIICGDYSFLIFLYPYA